MRRTALILTAVAVLVAPAALAQQAAPGPAHAHGAPVPTVPAVLTVQGLGGPATTLDAAALAALPRERVTLGVHGTDHVFEGPALAAVLAGVEAPLGAALRGPALATVVEARAADGYIVVLSLGEVDPALRPTRVIVADTVDGRPLSAEEGPFRLVVEGDARPARSARQLVSVRLRRLDPDLIAAPPAR